MSEARSLRAQMSELAERRRHAEDMLEEKEVAPSDTI